MKKSYLLIIPTLSLILASCNGNQPVPDTTLPSVGLNIPDNTITNNLIVNATANDDTGVTKVEFYDNGIVITTDNEAPYQYTTEYTSSNNGQHVIKAIAYDAAGNYGEDSKTITVAISTPVTTDITAPTTNLTVSPNSLTNAGDVTLNSNAADNQGVAKVDFYDNDILIGTTANAPFTLVHSYTSAQNGTHTLKTIVTDVNGNTARSTATLTVNIPLTPAPDTTLPTASISGPQIVDSSAAQQFAVQAADNTGVTKVELYDNGKLIGSSTQAPYTFSTSYSSADNGQHTIIVKAYDATGNVGTSSFTVIVNIPVPVVPDTTLPKTSVTSSTTTLNTASQITFTAQASDNIGIIKVEFYDNGVLLNTVASAPYTINKAYTSTDNGQHTITVKAYDAAGNIGSGTTTLIVNIPTAPITDTVSPTIIVNGPQNVTSTGQVTYTAQASDNVGVTKVEFYEGSNLLTTRTQAPYTYTTNYNSNNNGTHTITVKAYDATGNIGTNTTSTTVNIPTADTTPPNVTLTVNPTNLTSAGNVTFTSTASDNIGIAKVEWYDNGVLTATTANTPYVFTRPYSSNENGTHTITTKAYDTNGNTSTATASLTVNIPVLDTTAPTVNVSANPSSLTSAGSVTYTAQASDNVDVTKVEFYEGTTLLATRTTAPYSYTTNYTSTNNGTHTITVKASDAAGNISSATTSSVVNITIQQPVITSTLINFNGADYGGGDPACNYIQMSVIYQKYDPAYGGGYANDTSRPINSYSSKTDGGTGNQAVALNFTNADQGANVLLSCWSSGGSNTARNSYYTFGASDKGVMDTIIITPNTQYKLAPKAQSTGVIIDQSGSAPNSNMPYPALLKQ